MGSRARVNVAIGVAMIVIGVASPLWYRHWLATRTFVPLDIPITFSRGHIKTGEFNINLRETYFVSIDTDGYTGRTPDCRSSGPNPLLQTHITLLQNGRVTGEAEATYPPYGWLARFDADEVGRYSLDVEVLSDASCLNPQHPRLRVSTWSRGFYEDFDSLTYLVSLFLVVGGVGLVVRSTWLQVADRMTDFRKPTIYEDTGLRYKSRPLKLPLQRRISDLPTFGFFGALVLMVTMIVMMVLNTPVTPVGIYVTLLKQAPQPESTSNAEPSPIIQIRDFGPRVEPRIYLNSQLVSREELSTALKASLSRRPDWVVYVQSDPNVPWADAVYAMDVARGLRAKVVLLTPQTAGLLKH
jgi:biopolymer transport protein ExbD